jgi:hypothetical protein
LSTIDKPSHNTRDKIAALSIVDNGGDKIAALSTIDNAAPKHNTQKTIANDLGWSTGNVAMEAL